MALLGLGCRVGFSLVGCPGFSLWWLLLLWKMGSRVLRLQWLWLLGSSGQVL